MKNTIVKTSLKDGATEECCASHGWNIHVTNVVVVVRLEHSHSFNDSLDNHSSASGPAWCRSCRPPGNVVSGHSSTMCLVVWWLSPQGQASLATREGGREGGREGVSECVSE